MAQIFVLALIMLGSTAVQADIYKCEDEQGNVAYQQLPCPVVNKAVEVPEEPEKTADEPPPAAEHRSPAKVEKCKEPLHDAIDAIEAEMLRGYSAEQGENFKLRLRTLTQQMRACE